MSRKNLNITFFVVVTLLALPIIILAVTPAPPPGSTPARPVCIDSPCIKAREDSTAMLQDGLTYLPVNVHVNVRDNGDNEVFVTTTGNFQTRSFESLTAIEASVFASIHVTTVTEDFWDTLSCNPIYLDESSFAYLKTVRSEDIPNAGVDAGWGTYQMSGCHELLAQIPVAHSTIFVDGTGCRLAAPCIYRNVGDTAGFYAPGVQIPFLPSFTVEFKSYRSFPDVKIFSLWEAQDLFEIQTATWDRFVLILDGAAYTCEGPFVLGMGSFDRLNQFPSRRNIEMYGSTDPCSVVVDVMMNQ